MSPFFQFFRMSHKGDQDMEQTLQVDAVEVKKVAGSGMSRCLFGDWPRRRLLKLTSADYEGAQSFWNPQEKRPSKIPVSAPE